MPVTVPVTNQNTLQFSSPGSSLVTQSLVTSSLTDPRLLSPQQPTLQRNTVSPGLPQRPASAGEWSYIPSAIRPGFQATAPRTRSTLAFPGRDISHQAMRGAESPSAVPSPGLAPCVPAPPGTWDRCLKRAFLFFASACGACSWSLSDYSHRSADRSEEWSFPAGTGVER